MPEDNRSHGEQDDTDNPSSPKNPNPVSAPTKETAPHETENSGKRPHWADSIMAVFTVLIFFTYLTANYFSWRTLQEIKSGGADTHDLAVASKAQADRTKELSESARIQAANAAAEVEKLSALVWATNKQAATMSGQLAVMQKQVEAVDRPWFSVGASITSPMSFDGSAVHIGISVVAQNIGKSPAQHAMIIAEIVPDMGLIQARERLNVICSSGGTTPVTYPKLLGHVVFPGGQYILRGNMGLSLKEMRSFWSQWEKPPKDMLAMALVGCVVYGFSASQSFHQTRFAYELLTNDERPILLRTLPLDPESLLLRHNEIGNELAN